MQPVLSVIVPVYNTKEYLPRCIDSILTQSFSDFELLLIDDGSTDGSGSICDAYSAVDKRVRVFHKKNGGVSTARNLGLDKALGVWVTFIDSDDYVLDNFFTVPFESHIDLYVQNWRYASGRTKEFISSRVVIPEEYCLFLENTIKTDLFRTACCSFFKRAILLVNNIRFDTRFRLGEDTLFVLDYYKYARSLQMMDNSYYIYNRQDNWNDKYNLTWMEARDYLSCFMDRYEALSIDAPQLPDFMFCFVSQMISNRNHLRVRWCLAKPVLRYKKLKLPFKSKLYKAKYYIARTLSIILNV